MGAQGCFWIANSERKGRTSVEELEDTWWLMNLLRKHDLVEFLTDDLAWRVAMSSSERRFIAFVRDAWEPCSLFYVDADIRTLEYFLLGI